MNDNNLSDQLNRKISASKTTKVAIIKEMIAYGKLAAKTNLIYGNFGNLSVKYDNEVYITRSGTMLGNISENDIIAFKNGIPEDASSDTPIHLGIYEKIKSGAIMHMHGDYTIILSLHHDDIYPLDFVGSRFLGHIPVVDGEFGSATLTTSLIENIETKGVIVRKHGSFTVGENLRQAYVLSSALETSCKLLYLNSFYKNKED